MASQVTPELVVVDDIARAAAERFIALRPTTVALAGGSTPRPLYERLATCRFPWAHTDIFFGDERCVPPEHEASNFRMANEALLAKVPARVHRMPGETCDAAAYEDELSKVFGTALPQFDLVLLGLGGDGHIASLFPGDPALDVTDRWVVRIERPDYARLTLTLPVLSAAKAVMFLVSGAPKRVALRNLLAAADMPATRVKADRVLIVADQAAG